MTNAQYKYALDMIKKLNISARDALLIAQKTRK